MFKVPNPNYPPQHCAVSGKTQDPEGFIDFGIELPGVMHNIDPHLYLCVSVARDIGRFAGMVDREEYERVQGELARVERELENAKAELEESERFAESVEYTLRGIDKIRHKPGPRKMKETV